MRSLRRHQNGVVLVIALIMMITITLAGLALFRQVGLGSVIVGNLAFKQGATRAADRGVESARAWLMTPNLASIPVLQGDLTGVAGYYPASCYTQTSDWGASGTPSNCDRTGAPSFDPFTYTWTDANSVLVTGPDTDANGVDAAGNSVRFVVHRLCNMDGSLNEVREYAGNLQAVQACSLATSGRSCLNNDLYNAANCITQAIQPYYRVTARVEGARNTRSLVEVILF